MPFEVGKFKFEFTPLEQIVFPADKSSTLKGAFGNTFKRIVCVVKQKDCTACMLKTQCVYAYIFETALIEPPEVPQTIFEPDQKYDMNLIILIGKAIQYLPYFVMLRFFEDLS